MIEQKRILYNAIKTPDGTILHSKHVHDMVTHIDKNGCYYMVDGGNDYLRRTLNDDAPYENLTVYDDGKHETRREYLYWGKNYDENMVLLPKTQWIPIKDLSTEHIKAILNGGHVANNNFYKEIFKNELEFRNK